MFDEYLAMIGITNDNVGSIIMFVAPFAIAFMFWIGAYDHEVETRSDEDEGDILSEQRRALHDVSSPLNPSNPSHPDNL